MKTKDETTRTNLALMTIGLLTCLFAITIALTGCGSNKTTTANASGDASSSSASASASASAAAKVDQNVAISAADWDAETSTPAIAHITGNGADFYTAISPNKAATLKLDEGDYDVSVISPVNADGSLYVDADRNVVTKNVSITAGNGTIEIALDKIAADDVTQEMADTVMSALTTAIEHGDATLKGDAGAAIVSAYKTNLAKAPTVNGEAIENAAKSATDATSHQTSTASPQAPAESAGSHDATQTQPTSTSTDNGGNADNGNSGNQAHNDNNSGQAQTQEPAKQRVWVDEVSHTEQQLVQAAYDEPVYDTVYVNVCNACGYQCQDQGQMNSHMRNHARNNESASCGVISSQVQVNTIHHDAVYETVTVVDTPGHWEER